MRSISLAFTIAFFASLGVNNTTSAQDDKNLILADNTSLEANWAMYSDDAYLGTRAGCYESLTRISQDVLVEPALAESWQQTEPTLWEFKIREGVKFQDGTELNAEAVAVALNHLIDADVPARAFSNKIVESVTASDAMTVRIKTIDPVVGLPGRMASPATTILSPAAYTQTGVNPVSTCTGPFAISEFDPEQSISLVRNDNYWGGKPKLDGGQIRFIPDSNTRSTMARSGEAHISRLIPNASVAQLEGSEEVVTQEVNAPRITELLLNNARAPFDNRKVREAVKLAIDTKAISAAIYEGYAPPADDPFRSGEPWEAADVSVVEVDLEKSKTLFAEADIDPTTLELEILAYTSKTELRDVAQVVQAMLGELGIKVSVRLAEYSSLEGDMMSGNYDMALMSRGYLTDVPEPIGFLTADYGCEGGFNISQHCNEEIDVKLTAAAAQEDDKARHTAYAELAQYVYDQAVTVFLVNETVFDANSNKVTGYTPHPLNYYVFSADLDLE